MKAGDESDRQPWQRLTPLRGREQNGEARDEKAPRNQRPRFAPTRPPIRQAPDQRVLYAVERARGQQHGAERGQVDADGLRVVSGRMHVERQACKRQHGRHQAGREEVPTRETGQPGVRHVMGRSGSRGRLR